MLFHVLSHAVYILEVTYMTKLVQLVGTDRLYRDDALDIVKVSLARAEGRQSASGECDLRR